MIRVFWRIQGLGLSEDCMFSYKGSTYKSTCRSCDALWVDSDISSEGQISQSFCEEDISPERCHRKQGVENALLQFTRRHK